MTYFSHLLSCCCHIYWLVLVVCLLVTLACLHVCTYGRQEAKEGRQSCCHRLPAIACLTAALAAGSIRCKVMISMDVWISRAQASNISAPSSSSSRDPSSFSLLLLATCDHRHQAWCLCYSNSTLLKLLAKATLLDSLQLSLLLLSSPSPSSSPPSSPLSLPLFP